jgi:hypothetical protein
MSLTEINWSDRKSEEINLNDFSGEELGQINKC